MFVRSWYTVQCFRFGQTCKDILVIFRAIDSYSDRAFGAFPISGPVLSLILSSDFTSLIFRRMEAGLGWLRRSCGSAWFGGDNGRSMVGLVRNRLIVIGRNKHIGGWRLCYVCIEQWYLLPHTRRCTSWFAFLKNNIT